MVFLLISMVPMARKVAPESPRLHPVLAGFWPPPACGQRSPSDPLRRRRALGGHREECAVPGNDPRSWARIIVLERFPVRFRPTAVIASEAKQSRPPAGLLPR